MLVLGGHGVLGTMIAEAAQAAGWTTIRTAAGHMPVSVMSTWLNRKRWRR